MKEQIIVVDENDNIIWQRDRYSKAEPNTRHRISILRVENSKWEVLIAQRALNKKFHPWKRWAAVWGTNNPWETYESNIIKETKEEIWYDLINFKKYNKDKTEHVFAQVFTAIIDQDISYFKIQKEEVATLKRITKQDLLNEIDKYPENFTKSFLRRAKNLNLL
jgi:isopentenyldiphosphate isomerase